MLRSIFCCRSLGLFIFVFNLSYKWQFPFGWHEQRELVLEMNMLVSNYSFRISPKKKILTLSCRVILNVNSLLNMWKNNTTHIVSLPSWVLLNVNNYFLCFICCFSFFSGANSNSVSCNFFSTTNKNSTR